MLLLDLCGSVTGEKLLKDSHPMFKISKPTFDLDYETLYKHISILPSDLRGHATLKLVSVSPFIFVLLSRRCIQGRHESKVYSPNYRV